MKRTTILLILTIILVGATQSSLAAHPPRPPRPLPGALDELAFLEPGPSPFTTLRGLVSRLALQAVVAPGAIVPWSKLVFQSFRDSNWEIYLADGDGSNPTRLTERNSSDLQPQLNRGCTRIVFVSNRAGNYEIYTMNLDGGGVQRLTFDLSDEVLPAWSPDGGKIAFEDYRNKQAEIYVIDSDGSNQTRLTWSNDFDGAPAWSPDGSQIAFVSDRSGGSRIWLMNADGSGKKQLSNQAYSDSPAWSPDGSQIAFSAAGDDDYDQELWLMNADGSNQREVYDANTTDTDVLVQSWSPDGRYVAFTRLLWVYYQDKWYWTHGYLYTWDSLQGGAVRLNGENADWRPSWQTTDTQSPTSSMDALPRQSPGPFSVNWSGSDSGASGLRSYDVQVRENGGNWNDWHMGTSLTTASYPGVGGQIYYFRARARDNAHNVEAWPSDHDAWTSVEALAPRTSVQALADYSRSSDELTVSWGGSDPGDSGIQGYDVQYRDADAGSWSDWQVQTLDTAASFAGTVGHTYHFRSRATDNAQNVESWPRAGDTHTTFYTWGISGALQDNTGVPLLGATSSITPPAFVTSSDEGAFAAYVATSAITYTATWARDGYGDLPLTSFGAAQDARVDVVLPPADNVLRDWGFEGLDGSLILGEWQAGGVITPEISADARHTGDYAALLGWQALTFTQQSADSSIAQTVSLPITISNPTLSFFYQLNGAAAASGSWFEVQVDNGTAAIPLWSTDSNTAGWTHRWFDLSPWAGQSINLLFNVHQQAGAPRTWAYLDEVSVGSVYPDLWVSKDSLTAAALPGEQVIYTIAYGNRGSVAASGARITVTLPADLFFVEASPPPTFDTLSLLWAWEWEVGNLAAGSGPFSIVLTTTVAPTATMLNTLTSTASIRSVSPHRPSVSIGEVETANNVAQATVLVAYQTYLPLLAK